MKKNEMTKKLMEEFNEDFIDVGGVLDTTLPDPTMVEYYRRLKSARFFGMTISATPLLISLCISKSGTPRIRELRRKSVSPSKSSSIRMVAAWTRCSTSST